MRQIYGISGYSSRSSLDAAKAEHAFQKLADVHLRAQANMRGGMSGRLEQCSMLAAAVACK